MVIPHNAITLPLWNEMFVPLDAGHIELALFYNGLHLRRNF